MENTTKSVFKLVMLASSVTVAVSGNFTEPVCRESESAVTITDSIVACGGRWEGHIENADVFCGLGYSVCSWEDKENILSQISWELASQSVAGCYAYNAAQDGDTCSPCKDDVESDDMAGIGRDCPHKNFGQTGCLNSGKIEASCCMDAMRFRACHSRLGITTGVLCCKRERTLSNKGRNEPIQQRNPTPAHPPPLQEVHLVGERIHLKCPLMTRKGDHVTWNMNGENLTNSNKVSLYIPFASVLDSGLYSCADRASLAYINLTIYSVPSFACRDGSSEGFHESQNVRGCSGKWKGHVKKANREICGRNWRVCKPTDKAFLDFIDNDYLTNFGGCFAYNGMDTGIRCSQCKNSAGKSLASIGSECPVNEKIPATTSRNTICYRRKIAIYPDKFLANHGRGCVYRENHGITGVLCCRKPRQTAIRHHHTQQQIPKSLDYPQDDSTQTENSFNCRPQCRNGGTCLRDGRCLCRTGFHGIACQHGGCNPKCLNGAKCLYGWCRCELPFYGSSCQHTLTNWHLPSNDMQPTEKALSERNLTQSDGAVDFDQISNSVPLKLKKV